METAPIKILMVCTANICRSPYAELRARALSGGRIEVSSAGVYGYVDHPIDHGMANELAKRGILSEEFRSRRLTKAMIDEADLVLTAEAGHRAHILDEWPGAVRKVFTFEQFVRALKDVDPGTTGRDLIAQAYAHRGQVRPDHDIPDPFQRGSVAAELAASALDKALTTILRRLDGTGAPAATVTDDQVDRRLAGVGVRIPDILLPREGVPLDTWAVVACDQFTSQPEYWREVEARVGTHPSTLRLIFPEVYLDQPGGTARIASINQAMRDYLAAGLFRTFPRTMFLVRRETGQGIVRWGLVVALDLEQYDWTPGSTTLIRATEGTILDRIPPRKAIRRDAPLELPHILVLISDAARRVIEPLAAKTHELTHVYDVDLMLGGGRVAAWAVDGQSDLAGVADGLVALRKDLDPANPLLFAMGDGNHSFATAKSIWDDVREGLTEQERATHPARFCLVELENIFDAGLTFEPIHRVLFGLSREAFEAALSGQCASFAFEGTDDVLARIADQSQQRFGYADADAVGAYTLTGPSASIPAGTLQKVIDGLVASGACEVDYIHGADVALELGRRPGNSALLLPPVAKETFFATIVADGALPRKTFSMGHAEDKRYYLEARRIAP